MTSSIHTERLFSDETKKLYEAYCKLDTDTKLAFLYFIYERMGESITPAAPEAADPNLAPILLGDFYTLESDRQLDIMREIVNGADTEYSRAYGALASNNQLLVWYAWAQGMGDTVVDLPDDYEFPESMYELLAQMESIDFQGQISLLREVAASMGLSNVQPVPTQAETGKTSSL